MKLTTWQWLGLAVVVILGLSALFIVPAVIGGIIGANTRPAVATAAPTASPTPIPVPCDLSDYNYLGVTIPPMDPNTTQTIPFPGGSVSLKCGPLGGKATGSVTFNPTATPVIPTVAPKRSCMTPDGFTILDGGNWKEGVQAYQCVDGAKVPAGTAPATPQPTSIAAPTAAPVQFNCPASFVKNGAVGNALPNAEAQKDGTTDIYICTASGWQWARTAPVAP